MMRLDADAVRALLTPSMVLDHFEVKRSGSTQLATAFCPHCGQLKRASVSIHRETGAWKCFAGDVRVLTDEGTFPIKELAGKCVRLLVPSAQLANVVGRDLSGFWKECAVRSFGKQKLWELTITRNGVSKKIKTTAEHRWFLRSKPRKSRRQITTAKLRPGQRLASLIPQPLTHRETGICPHGVAHGFVFGDGNVNGGASEVTLYGNKDAPLAPFFYNQKSGKRVLKGGVIGRYIGRLPLFFKSLPSLNESPAYIAGFLAGLFAADGCVGPTGHPALNCADKHVLEQVQTFCHRIGIATYEILEQERLVELPQARKKRAAFGGIAQKKKFVIYRLPLLRSTLPSEFFLVAEHRKRFKANASFGRMGWRVKSVRRLKTKEEVFCAVVPGQEAFTLEGNILTGNCHHCGTGGGIIALAAGYAGIDVRADFHKAVGFAAAIAGIPRGVDAEDYAQLLAESKKRREEFAVREKASRARAVARMPSTWSLLDRRSVKGESYLRGRNIDPDRLRELDLVRYHHTGGDPAVALRDLATGKIVGIQYRCLQGEVKLICSPGSQVAGSALVSHLGDIEKCRLAVLVEGLADSLVARLLWPDAAIFGAPGAGQLEGIARAVAPEVMKQNGILILVPDNDAVGTRAGAKAVIAAQAAGLELAEFAAPTDARKILVADLGNNLADQPHHDIAQAWTTSRWRWTWPMPEAR